jgi:energy-coupling factor transporter ATP-binding protein EcfA2
MELPILSSSFDFWGNQKVKLDLADFFNNKEYSILILGPSGSGKTTLCQLYLDVYAHKYCTYRPHYEVFQNHKDFINSIDNFLNTQSISELLNKQKKLLFLDDVDSLFNTNRYANSYIQEMLKRVQIEQRDVKIIMTCCSGMEKKVAEIKRKVKTIYIVNPPVENIFSYIIKSNSYSCINPDKIKNHIQKYNCNVRNCILNLNSLRDVTQVKSHDSIYKILFDQNIIDIAKNILQAPNWTLKKLELWLSTDPNLLLYVMFDNISLSNLGLSNLLNILKAFSISSIFESCIYAKNDWILSDICNLYRCAVLKTNIRPECYRNQKLHYTTIPTRCSNYYCSIKKNAVYASSLWLTRNDILTSIEYNCIQNEIGNAFNKKILNVKIPRLRNK